MANFQREGAISNSHAGREFQEAVRAFLASRGVLLQLEYPLPIGGRVKKVHRFDLGADKPPVIVECKSYTWTSGGNSPSAKIRGLNEAMLHFSVAPQGYQKFLFMLRHMRGEESLAQHYVRTQGHLIGADVEVWELDPTLSRAERAF